MNPCFFEDRTARQRIAAEMIVARIEHEERTARQRIAAEIVARIEHNQRSRRLQDQAIQRADRRRFHRAMLRNGIIFIAAAVSIFALIWWCGL